MQDVYIIVLTVLVGALAILFFYAIRARKRMNDGEINGLNSRFDALSSSLNQSLRDTLKLINDQLKDNRDSVERSSQNVHRQVEGFTSGLSVLRENLKQVHETIRGVSSFQEMFRSPKLRGIWGEASLEASLEQYFPRESYELQHYFKSGEAVDAALKLPNDLLLPVDSKFNWENFGRMVNADEDSAKEQYRKIFFSDVRKKIDEISAKYILPGEGTTDLALMFVPAETVYYEIISNLKDVDLPAYARSKRVWLVSPNTFGLSVAAIRHWLKDVQLSKQTKEIMKRLERIAVDGRKLGEEFQKLGKHLDNARGSYDSTEKRLSLMVDRVESVVEIEESENEGQQLTHGDRGGNIPD